MNMVIQHFERRGAARPAVRPRAWRFALALVLLALAAGLQGCFILDIGSRVSPGRQGGVNPAAVDVDRPTGPNKIRQLDPEGKLRGHGPQLVASAQRDLQ